jgi:CubicO group peptidase (beta-lactamase class C family)
VEEVHLNGFVQIVYSHGYYQRWGMYFPGYFRAIGQVTNDELQFPTPGGNLLTYRVNGGELHVTSSRGGKAVVAKTEPGQIGCARLANTPHPVNQPSSKRNRLTREELVSVYGVPDAPVHNDYFKPLGRHNPPLHAFEGRLTVASHARTARHGCRGADIIFPQVTLAFMTVGDDLVPAVRDIIHPPGTSGRLEWIISPGKVWSEPADGGMSRAAFPFVLTNQVSNKTHNGIATFLYNEKEVSALRFQIVQETAAWARADFWGQARLHYAPGPIEGRERLGKRFAMERAAELPIRPWEELSQRLTPQLSESFGGAWAREHVSATGLVVDSVIYMPPCRTRYGDFPYCRHMRHGVFSVTKSMGAALTLLRLAQKYGPEVFDLKIKDYVTVTADHTGWDKVTFTNALNMAVGVGEHSPRRFPLNIAAGAENRSKRLQAWLREPTRAGKLRLAFEYPDYPWEPGEVARYDTTHTFVLTAAMDGFYKSKEGLNADLWDMVRTEVLEPIGVFHAPIMRTVESDGSRGLPIFGYGFYPTVEDATKIAILVQNEGRHKGNALLHPPSTREALYRTAETGLATGRENRYGSGRYHWSFWSAPYRSKEGCFFQIPYMLGYGGNFVVLMPNGITAVRFADGHNYEIESLVLAAEYLEPLCPPGSIKSVAKTRRGMALTAKALRSLIPENTMYYENETVHSYYASNGTVFLSLKNQRLLGKWRIDEAGHLCTRWSTARNGDETCFRLYRDGDDYIAEATDRWRILHLKLAQGNPERY